MLAVELQGFFTFCEVYFLFLWVSGSGQWEQQ
jgi:hypothetical protein